MLLLLCKWMFLTLNIWGNYPVRNISIKDNSKAGDVVTIFPLSYTSVKFAYESNMEKYFEVFHSNLNDVVITGLRLRHPANQINLEDVCPLMIISTTGSNTTSVLYLSMQVVHSSTEEVMDLPSSKLLSKNNMQFTKIQNGKSKSEVFRRVKREWDWKEFDVMEEQPPPQLVCNLKSSFDNRTGNVLYYMEGEGAGSIFKMDEHEGKVETVVRLDREKKSSYTLKIYATDLNHKIIEGPSSVVVAVLDINDHKPRFISTNYVGYVEERAKTGTEIITVKATDNDDSTRPYGQLKYSIVGDSRMFAIHPTTGVVRVKSNNIDRERQDKYELTIKAKDDPHQVLGFFATTNLTIRITDVNDNPPKFFKDSYRELAYENFEIGDEVSRISAEDSDLHENRLNIYSISGDGAEYFSVQTLANTAVIKVAKTLDYETAPQHRYSFVLTATNVAKDSRFDYINTVGSTELIVDIIDVDEEPEFPKGGYTFNVNENAKRGDHVGLAKAVDPEGDLFLYKLLNYGDVFVIDLKTGLISVKGALDRETKSSYKVQVQAGRFTTSDVIINIDDVNDNPPEPTKENIEVVVCVGEKDRRQILYPPIEMKDRDDPATGGVPFHYFPTKSIEYDMNFDLVDNGDNTASLRTKHNKFYASEDKKYHVPIFVSDNGTPRQNATYIVTVRPCYCSPNVRDKCSSFMATAVRIDLLVAILVTMTLLLLVVLVLLLVRRRQRKALADSNQKLSLYDEDDDVRENVIKYNEEGGGEEDTAAYDITAFSNLGSPALSNTPIKMKPPLPHFRPSSGDMQSFLDAHKEREDEDANKLPFDSLQVYAYEGTGSLAGSLSSINSTGTEVDDMDYDHMRQWGPKFDKLADIYNNGYSDTDEEDEDELDRKSSALPHFNYTFSSQGSVRRQPLRNKPRLVRTATPL